MTVIQRYEPIKVVDSIRDSFRRQIQSSSRLMQFQIDKKKIHMQNIPTLKHTPHTHMMIILLQSQKKTYLKKPLDSFASTNSNKTIRIEKVQVPRLRHVSLFLISIQLKSFFKILFTCVKKSSIGIGIKTCSLCLVRTCSRRTHHKPNMLFIAEKIVHPWNSGREEDRVKWLCRWIYRKTLDHVLLS